MKKYAFGVDIGGTTVKIGFFETTGKMLDKWEIPTRKENGGSLILGDIKASIEEKLAKEGISKDDVQGVGMGVPGPVTNSGVVNKCANLGWGVFNVEKEATELFGLTVKAGNDANVASLGEMWMGGGKGYENVVMLTLGTGVGAGVILGGKIIHGVNGAGGEVGHMKVDDDETEVCGCGKTGCLEQYTSATGVVRLTNRGLAKGGVTTCLTSLEEITCKDVFDAARDGDAFSCEIVEKFGKILGGALAKIACVVDPEVFVIGGGVSKAGQILIDVVEKYYKAEAFHACEGTKISLATLGNDAGMYGCAKMAIDA
ncbi:MAG: ROK family glucokinase [Oscillospiraceae bacterium]|nr:ROK family glucokinase [Oscillospiraceae bacterium]